MHFVSCIYRSVKENHEIHLNCAKLPLVACHSFSIWTTPRLAQSGSTFIPIPLFHVQLVIQVSRVQPLVLQFVCDVKQMLLVEVILCVGATRLSTGAIQPFGGFTQSANAVQCVDYWSWMDQISITSSLKVHSKGPTPPIQTTPRANATNAPNGMIQPPNHVHGQHHEP